MIADKPWGFLTDGEAHGDPDTGRCRLIHQHCAAVKGGSGAHQHHSQADAEASVLQPRLANIAGEKLAPEALVDAAAAVLNGQVQLFTPAGQFCADASAPGGELEGVGKQIQDCPFQLVAVREAVNGFVEALVAQRNAGMLHQRGGFFKDLADDGTDIPDLLTHAGIGVVAFRIRHVINDPKHLHEPPVEPGYLLPGLGIIRQSGEGEEPVRGDHHAGQGIPQGPGSQGHGLELPVILVILQTEQIEALHPEYGPAHAVAGQGQIQIQTPACKGGVLLGPGFQKVGNRDAGFNQEACCIGVHFDNDAAFDTEGGAVHRVQHFHMIRNLFHDQPPHGTMMCKNQKNFRRSVRRNSIAISILAKNLENSKEKPKQR